MSKSYDLTTKAGLSEALSSISNHPAYKGLTFNPTTYLLDKAVDLIKSAFDIGTTIDAQRETAEAMIKAGKDNGASSIELTMDQDAGLSVTGNLGTENIEAKVGKSGKMTVRVNYKD